MMNKPSQAIIDKRFQHALNIEHVTLRAKIAQHRESYFANIPKSMHEEVRKPIAITVKHGEEVFQYRESLLKLAIRFRQVELVRELLRCSADIYQQTGEDNKTPIHELNDLLEADYEKGHMHDIRLSLISKSMRAQENLMAYLPYYTLGAVAAPVIISLFVLTGQLNYLQYYTALAIATIRIAKQNAPIIGSSFRMALYSFGTYFNFQTNLSKELPYIVKPSAGHNWKMQQLYDTVRLGLYLAAYTALSFHNIPLYGALFTAAIAACSVRQVFKLLMLVNEAKISDEDDFASREEFLSKLYNQEAKISKTVVKVFEKAAFALLVGSWFISPMNITTLAVLAVTGLAVYTTEVLLCAMIEASYLKLFEEDLQRLSVSGDGSETSSSLPESVIHKIDETAEYNSVSQTISWCFSGMIGTVSAFIIGHVSSKDGITQAFSDIYRLIGDTIDRVVLEGVTQYKNFAEVAEGDAHHDAQADPTTFTPV